MFRRVPTDLGLTNLGLRGLESRCIGFKVNHRVMELYKLWGSERQ